MEEMKDYIHNCLVCEELSFEVDSSEINIEEIGQSYTLYKCSKCGFEWEVWCLNAQS